jgi:hypothetical protein
VAPLDARVDLARRYLHAMGPGTPEGFATWAGLKPPVAAAAFAALEPTLVPVSTSIGDAVVLAEDEPMLRAQPGPAAPARLLPSGDPFYLLQGRDRELLVPDPRRRAALWTSRVWPGAVLVDGDIVGTWRRSKAVVTVAPWRRLTAEERIAVEAEAASLPIPEVREPASVLWSADRP